MASVLEMECEQAAADVDVAARRVRELRGLITPEERRPSASPVQRLEANQALPAAIAALEAAQLRAAQADDARAIEQAAAAAARKAEANAERRAIASELVPLLIKRLQPLADRWADVQLRVPHPDCPTLNALQSS